MNHTRSHFPPQILAYTHTQQAASAAHVYADRLLVAFSLRLVRLVSYRMPFWESVLQERVCESEELREGRDKYFHPKRRRLTTRRWRSRLVVRKRLGNKKTFLPVDQSLAHELLASRCCQRASTALQENGNKRDPRARVNNQVGEDFLRGK